MINKMNFEKIKATSRLPDQGLEIGNIVYSEYYQVVGRIVRLSPTQDIQDNPSYILSEIKDATREICFGVREHNWHHSADGCLKYDRLVKLNTWDDLPTYSTETSEVINNATGEA